MRDIKTKQRKKDIRTAKRGKYIRRRLAQKRALNSRISTTRQKGNGISEQYSDHSTDKSTHEETVDNITDRGIDTVRIAGHLIKQRGNRSVKEVVRHFSDKNAESARNTEQEPTAGVGNAENAHRLAKKRVTDRAAGKTTTRYTTQQEAAETKSTTHNVKASTNKDIKQPIRTIKARESPVRQLDLDIRNRSKHIADSFQMKHATRLKPPNANASMKQAAQSKIMAARGSTAISAKVKAFTIKLKSIIQSSKLLLNMAMAAGWLVIVAIIAVAVIAFVVASPFGVFFSNENGNDMTIAEAMQEFDATFQARIQAEVDALSAQDTYESVEVIYGGDGDGDTTNNWSDVLTVFAVKYSYDNMDEVLTFDEERKEALQEIFDLMNTFDIRPEVITEEVPATQEAAEQQAGEVTLPEDELPAEEPAVEIKKYLKVFVTINSVDYSSAAVELSFTEEQMELADEMMSPQYYELFAALFGIDLYDGTDVPGLINNLPPGTKGEAIVKAALTRLGDPYSQSLRGENRYVDCSYLAWWAYQQVGINIPMTSVEQAQFCADNGFTIAKEDLQPGDLVFWRKATCRCGRWQEIHHVGIYIGDGKVIEASYGKGRVVISKLYSSSKWQLHSFARPHI